jgi:hypothetical protein
MDIRTFSVHIRQFLGDILQIPEYIRTFHEHIRKSILKNYQKTDAITTSVPHTYSSSSICRLTAPSIGAATNASTIAPMSTINGA